MINVPLKTILRDSRYILWITCQYKRLLHVAHVVKTIPNIELDIPDRYLQITIHCDQRLHYTLNCVKGKKERHFCHKRKYPVLFLLPPRHWNTLSSINNINSRSRPPPPKQNKTKNKQKQNKYTESKPVKVIVFNKNRTWSSTTNVIIPSTCRKHQQSPGLKTQEVPWPCLRHSG